MKGDIRRCSSTYLSPRTQNIPLPELDDFPTPKRSPTQASYYQDESPKDTYFLPTLPLSGSVPRITGDTLVDLLTGEYDEFFEDLFIIDCRYDYEYAGGHIQGATNINDPQVLIDGFFNEPLTNAVVIFHCEFSHNRGPQLAGIFRELDRDKNKMCYPHLFYPNVFVLDGGYRQFYQEHPEMCDGGYTRMLDDFHRANGDLTKATTLFRKNVERHESHHRQALVAVNRSRVNHDFLKSPVAMSSWETSPVAARMLNFLASPLQPRRL